ncbi:hypothetical protein AU196_18000 [Mycobacterium sp. IS-1742]|uniref:DUF5642 family protein n=1 Tax=Mycobacterium sp. IS-1742 TaxID=1772285 RepID=UPI0007405680|nr:DUF5642 family protein [Mycobacterium sp. IS-1742]KUI26727.1 hypothetical protein AU196_18000 [Mycobacterium sp. IS-1742]
MRRFAVVVAVAVSVSSCGQPPPPPPAPSATEAAGPIDPSRMNRARYELPPGYEVSDLQGRVAPLAQWGYGPNWSADPPQCGALAEPPVDPATVRGFSASGDGGIVYAVAADGAMPVDPVLLDECGQWTLAAGPTSGAVRGTDPPPVPGVAGFGMVADTVTVVEGGTETRSHAETFVAAEGERLVYVTVVTDPGSPSPALDGEFAADLLTRTVAALRG